MLRYAALLVALTAFESLVSPARAVTSDSPEVMALVDKGLKYLEKDTEDGHANELGGKCLIGMAFHKRGAPTTHPRIVDALQACRDSLEHESGNIYTYSKALAVIFLAELGDSSHHELLRKYADSLQPHQKPHGGYGYMGYQTGDTSQTQYVALAFWEMINHGIPPDASAAQKCLEWFMRTQDPSGAWGYQGTMPESASLVPQTDSVGVSMAAAGMGGTLILGNCLGLLTPPQGVESLIAEGSSGELPPALRRADVEKKQKMITLPAGNIKPQQVAATIDRGGQWFDKNFSLDPGNNYECYYLYSLERYKSFDEYLSGRGDDEPEWYNRGYEYLKRTQQPDGSWTDRCGDPCATAFAVLFLMRSTQKSIAASLGEGTLVGGRGLPRDLSKLKLRGGKLVVQQNPTELDNLLDMLGDSKTDELDGLLNEPAALRVTDVNADQARRLQQIVRSGPPEARLLAVRALGKLRDLDYAPTLIFALTDPDRRVVREARDALRFVSRSFEGFGPPDNFNEQEQQQAVVRWKQWYATVRPDAPPLP